MPVTINFWVNFLSPHLNWFYNQIAIECEVNVICLFDNVGDRRSQGWTSNLHTNFNTCSVSEIDTFQLNIQDSYNVFGGFHLISQFYGRCPGLRKIKSFSVISEAPIVMSVTDRLFKSFKYFLFSIMYKSKLDYVFCMGNLGVKWYENFFEVKRLVNFQYFVEPGFVRERVSVDEGSCLKFVFVGQLIERKNILGLLNAYSQLSSSAWSLDIVGTGSQEVLLKNFVESNKLLSTKVNFVGVIDNVEVRNLLASGDYDYLVLPSVFDGWGAVCSEAWANGVKVLTNINCGASVLVNELPNFGEVYDGTQEGLFKVIFQLVEKSEKSTLGDRKYISTSYLAKQMSHANRFVDLVRLK